MGKIYIATNTLRLVVAWLAERIYMLKDHTVQNVTSGQLFPTMQENNFWKKLCETLRFSDSLTVDIQYKALS